MSDLSADQQPPGGEVDNAAKSAGALLRQARQSQGLHIAALAAAIKVTPRKLEALESDRYEELLDATFVRALAQAVCRALKIDAEPVLARLPQPPGKGLDQVSRGLNEPFRERGSRREASEWPRINAPVLWGSLALVVAAVAVYLMPPGLWRARTGTAPEEAASVPAGAASSTVGEVPTSVSPLPAAASVPTPVISVAAPAPAPSAAAAPTANAPASGPAVPQPPSTAAATSSALQIETSGASWVDVRDAKGKVLLSRLVEPGESLKLDAPAAPLRVKVGNAAVTRLSYRGQPVSLTTSGRDNVARLELK